MLLNQSIFYLNTISIVDIFSISSVFNILTYTTIVVVSLGFILLASKPIIEGIKTGGKIIVAGGLAQIGSDIVTGVKDVILGDSKKGNKDPNPNNPGSNNNSGGSSNTGKS
jgi:hypothetical protein